VCSSALCSTSTGMRCLLGAGEHRIPVDVLQLGLSPGVYMVRLESPSVMLYRPLVVVR